MDARTPLSRPARASRVLDTSLAASGLSHSSSSFSASVHQTPTPSSTLRIDDLGDSTSLPSFSTARKRPLDSSSGPLGASSSMSSEALASARRSRLADSFSATMSSRAQSRELYEAKRRAEEAEARAEELRVRVERLERDREWLDERERELRERAERETREREDLRKKEEGELRRLRLEAGDSKLRVEELSEELDRVKRRMGEELEQHRRKEERMNRNLATAEELVESASRRAEMAQQEAGLLRGQLDELEDEVARLGAAGRARGDGEEDEEERGDVVLLTKELARETLRAEQMGREVERWRREAEGLRGQVTQARELVERAREMEKRLEGMERVEAELGEVGAKLELVTREREEWEHILTLPASELTSLAPSPLITHLATLHSQLESTASQIVTLSQQVDALRAQVSQAEERAAQAQTELDEEREGKELVKLREQVERLEREKREETAAREEAQSELSIVQSALEKAEESKESLEQRLFELGEKIGMGQHVPPGQRVLQLASNPESDHFAVRAEQLDALRAERDALLSQQKGEGWVPAESWSAVQREKLALQEEAKQREKRMLRLKQVFAAKATEFREAVTSILGYKLNFSGNGRVRLTSIYDATTALVFQSSEDGSNTGSMRLIGVGERAEQGDIAEGEGVGGALEFWVRERGSIPCFLSQLTIECFEKTERGRRAGYAGGGGGEQLASED